MTSAVLLSTAYLPPAEYFARIIGSKKILIEREENYIKQTYRNRCYIITRQGRLSLTVPVLLGSFHKTPVKEIRIDYTKRWQQVHLGALVSAYSSSPFFIYYYEDIEKIILSNHEYLFDLNMVLLRALLRILKINIEISFTTDFLPSGTSEDDFRYRISPKKVSDYVPKPYIQVFSQEKTIRGGVSIVDMIFNLGKDAVDHL